MHQELEAADLAGGVSSPEGEVLIGQAAQWLMQLLFTRLCGGTSASSFKSKKHQHPLDTQRQQRCRCTGTFASLLSRRQPVPLIEHCLISVFLSSADSIVLKSHPKPCGSCYESHQATTEWLRVTCDQKPWLICLFRPDDARM